MTARSSIWLPGAAPPPAVTIGGSGRSGLVNNIGIPGAQGFGVGVCPVTPSGYTRLYGTTDPVSDNYGNYQYADGSIVVWVPAFCYKWGTGANDLAINAIDIKPYSAFGSASAAAALGYAVHRAFYDGGAIQPGFFVDKYLASNNGGIASSLKNGIPIASGAGRGTVFSDLNGAPANNYGGALAAARTRGANFFCCTRFIQAALALLSYAHARAATSSAYCAWYDAAGVTNFPKGANNNALGDTNDAAILYVSDGSAYPACPKTGSANLFSRTTHNGQNSGVCDLNGCIWQITPGLTSNGTNLYALKTSAQMKSLTGSNAGATDLWGATGIAANYDDVGTTWGPLWATGANRTVAFGNAAQVFAEDASGAPWAQAGLGVPLVGGVGGTNLFGNDLIWDYKPNEMCPLSAAHWSYGASAGVWTLSLYDVRGISSYVVGFRSASYL